ncbi:restriction endonuclease subunit S [Streptococcus suis]|uniref:restriction endonuclease subunit S n=1 Tax=Streptococcus suis TaxID=1307 RepID=UPI0037D9241A
MKTNNNIPAYRFQGYTDAWELRKLGEFVDKAVDNRGKTPPLDEEGTHPLIEVAALGGVHPDYTKIDKYLNDESFENNLRSYVKKDDILFTTVGSIGLVSLMDSREEAAIAQNIVAFRAKDNFVPSYLYSLFTNKENQKKAIRIVMGAVQPSIKVSQLVGVEYMLTQNRVEQEAIGTFFSTLDRHITLHQRKLDTLKEQKKTYLKLLFPAKGQTKPALRFQGFEDDWEEVKVADIFQVTRGQVLSTNLVSDTKSDEYPYPVYSSQTKNNGLMGFYKDYLFDTAITWTTDGANAGTVRFREGKFYSTNVNGVLLSAEGYSNLAISEILNTVAWKYVSKVGNPKLMNNIMSEIILLIPGGFAEQQVLSSFFQTLDQKIAQVEDKLASLKEMKKTLLRKLFV